MDSNAMSIAFLSIDDGQLIDRARHRDMRLDGFIREKMRLDATERIVTSC